MPILANRTEPNKTLRHMKILAKLATVFIVAILVFGSCTSQNGYTVSDSGNITIPILGDVKVYGLTLDDAKREIERKAELYLKNSSINLKLLSFKFTVIGEVNRPGSYTNYNNQLTVLEAIGRAGDITDYGNRKRVLVIRPMEKGTNTYRINLQDKNLLEREGYYLLPNDIVIVEPLKSKPFQLNLPTTTLLITSALSTFSSLILLLSFIKKQ